MEFNIIFGKCFDLFQTLLSLLAQGRIVLLSVLHNWVLRLEAWNCHNQRPIDLGTEDWMPRTRILWAVKLSMTSVVSLRLISQIKFTWEITLRLNKSFFLSKREILTYEKRKPNNGFYLHTNQLLAYRSRG